MPEIQISLDVMKFFFDIIITNPLLKIVFIFGLVLTVMAIVGRVPSKNLNDNERWVLGIFAVILMVVPILLVQYQPHQPSKEEKETIYHKIPTSDPKPNALTVQEPAKPLQTIEPCVFISGYYHAQNDGDVLRAWKMISQHAKEESAPLLTDNQRLKEYSDRANSFESITFQNDCEVKTSDNADEVIVKGTVIYKYLNKKPIPRSYSHVLIKEGESWLINSHPSNKRK